MSGKNSYLHFSTFLAALLLGLLSACDSHSHRPSGDTSPVGASSPAPSPAPVLNEADGTMDGGGGDFIKDPDATAKDVHLAISEAQEVTPMVIRFFESIKRNDRISLNIWDSLNWRPEDYLALMKALFSDLESEDNVYAHFKNITWDVREELPCLDERGEEKAASAYPYENSVICLSVPMITKVAKKVNLVRRITALIVHEFLHKRGLRREALPRQIENKLSHLLPENPVAEMSHRLDQVHPLFYAHSDEYLAALAASREIIKNRRMIEIEETSVTAGARHPKELVKDPVRLCEFTERLRMSVFALKITEPPPEVPLELFTHQDFLAIEKLKEQSIRLRGFCTSGAGVKLDRTAEAEALLAEIYKSARSIADSMAQLPHRFVSSEVLLREFEPQ